MKPEQERVKNLLTDTVTLLCKNGLNFNKELKVQGLLGITLDGSDVFIVHINEKCGGEIVAVRADDGDEDLAALGLTYPRDTASPNLSRVKNRKSASTTSKHHGSDSPSAQTHSPKERVRLKRSNNTAEGSSQEPIQIKAEPDDDMFSSSCEKQGELDSRLAPDQPIGDSSGFGADFSQSLKHDPGDQDSNHGDSQENDTGPPTAKRKPPSSLSSARGSTSSDTTTTPFITGIIRNSVTDKTEPISGNAGSGEMGPLNQDSQVVVDSAPSWDASSESQGSQGISQTAESTAQDTMIIKTAECMTAEPMYSHGDAYGSCYPVAAAVIQPEGCGQQLPYVVRPKEEYMNDGGGGDDWNDHVRPTTSCPSLDTDTQPMTTDAYYETHFPSLEAEKSIYRPVRIGRIIKRSKHVSRRRLKALDTYPEVNEFPDFASDYPTDNPTSMPPIVPGQIPPGGGGDPSDFENDTRDGSVTVPTGSPGVSPGTQAVLNATEGGLLDASHAGMAQDAPDGTSSYPTTDFSFKSYRSRFGKDKQHICGILGCGKTFYQRCSMLRHQRMSHGALTYQRTEADENVIENPHENLAYQRTDDDGNIIENPQGALAYQRTDADGNIIENPQGALAYQRTDVDGNIIDNPHGSLPYQRTDAEKNVVENPHGALAYQRQDADDNVIEKPQYDIASE